ncbi:hypothetical protein C8J57DRAFT_1522297 [Mycena rebaudengoi]|nr:hypothetical protein C8J57DRAFT_1522297 [Mycena rebaudengoi]
MAKNLPTCTHYFLMYLAYNRLAVGISFLVMLCGVGEALISSTKNTGLSPLPDFIHEAFAQLTSTNDTVFEAALHNFYSPHVQARLELPLPATMLRILTSPSPSEVATSSNLTCAAFGELVQGLRTKLSQRQLIREIFVVDTPADPTNRTGAVAATHVFSAVQDGQQVVVTIASLLRIQWVQDETYDQGGRREIVTEVLITSAAPYQGDEM